MITRAYNWLSDNHKLLGSVYYTLATIGIAIGIVGGAVTLIVNYANRSDKRDILAEPFGEFFNDATYLFILQHRWAILALCSAVLVSGGIGKYFLLKRRLSSFDIFGEIWNQYADLLSDVRAVAMNPRAAQRDVAAVSSRIDQFVVNSATRISVFFEKYTGSKCHVSLKLYDAESKEVRTLARDLVALRDRSAVDASLEWYPYTDNSAYVDILDGSKSAFRSNHLRLRSLVGRYKNSNPSWQRLYYACLVVPVVPESNSNNGVNRDSVWGFLTVDNKSGGFDREISTSVLQSFAGMYYNLVAESSSISTDLLG